MRERGGVVVVVVVVGGPGEENKRVLFVCTYVALRCAAGARRRHITPNEERQKGNPNPKLKKLKEKYK